MLTATMKAMRKDIEISKGLILILYESGWER